MGDLKDAKGKPLGNGDSSLTLFGEKVTPNEHKIAREFVTLDNTLCSGEVSGNGHPWSTGAISTDIGERAWMLAYGGHADWPLLDKDIYPPAGRVWDVAEREGKSFASYCFTWATNNTERNMPAVCREGYDKRCDTVNGNIFAAELKQYEKNNLPNLMIMSLREDYTEGTRPGAFTPQACIASNDQGVGEIIAACSRSRYWKEMAIFIIEDDAQDSADHVDAHRTTAFVVSPHSCLGRVDGTRYNTVSMLRTIELILGLPPMPQYDATAPPMYAAFAGKLDLTPYTLHAPRIDLNVKNAAVAYGAAASERMNFSEPDHLTRVQVVALNRILWHSTKGPNVPYPARVGSQAVSNKGARR